MSLNVSVQLLVHNRQNVLCGMIWIDSFLKLFDSNFVPESMSSNEKTSIFLHEQIKTGINKILKRIDFGINTICIVLSLQSDRNEMSTSLDFVV